MAVTQRPKVEGSMREWASLLHNAAWHALTNGSIAEAVFLTYGVAPGFRFSYLFEGTIKKGSSSILGVHKGSDENSLIPEGQHAIVIRFRAKFEVFRDLFIIQTGLHQGLQGIHFRIVEELRGNSLLLHHLKGDRCKRQAQSQYREDRLKKVSKIESECFMHFEWKERKTESGGAYVGSRQSHIWSHGISIHFQLYKEFRLNLQEADGEYERRKWLRGSTGREHRGNISTKRALAGEQSGEV